MLGGARGPYWAYGLPVYLYETPRPPHHGTGCVTYNGNNAEDKGSKISIAMLKFHYIDKKREKMSKAQSYEYSTKEMYRLGLVPSWNNCLAKYENGESAGSTNTQMLYSSHHSCTPQATCFMFGRLGYVMTNQIIYRKHEKKAIETCHRQYLVPVGQKRNH